MWPDVSASPVRSDYVIGYTAYFDEQAEKRAQQPRYRYLSPSPDGAVEVDGEGLAGRKRKAAADFL